MHSSFQFRLFLKLVRSLFPKWNFFDKLAHTFELHYKAQADQDWRCISFDQIHNIKNIVFNPTVNLALAQFNVVEHFSTDVQELGFSNSLVTETTLQNLSSYRLMKSLIAVKLQEAKETSNRFQFKIVALNESVNIDIFISEWISE